MKSMIQLQLCSSTQCDVPPELTRSHPQPRAPFIHEQPIIWHGGRELHTYVPLIHPKKTRMG